MIPETNLNIVVNNITNPVKRGQGKTYLYDFKKGDFVMKGGSLIEVEGIEAVKVWVEKILRTERFNFKIYETGDSIDEYGVTIRKLILGKKLPVFFLQSELKREISEVMVKHFEIDRIENFEIKHEMSSLIIYFTVVLKDGDSFNQEVNF